MENAKENQIQLKFVKILYIFKLFNIYIIKENKWNEFDKTYKKNREGKKTNVPKFANQLFRSYGYVRGDYYSKSAIW